MFDSFYYHLGGRLSEMYGSRWVMGLCSLAIGLCCFVAPLLAAVNFYLLFSDLILLGLFGSFMTPSIFTLFSRWLTPGEKSLFVSFYMVASRLGFGLSSLICGQMFKLGYSWRHVYLSAGKSLTNLKVVVDDKSYTSSRSIATIVVCMF